MSQMKQPRYIFGMLKIYEMLKVKICIKLEIKLNKLTTSSIKIFNLKNPK